MLLPGIVIAWGAAGRYRGHWRKTVLLAILLALAIWLPSCAGGATSGGSGSATTSQTTAGNYTITVTGTSGALAHNTSVGLDVESP